MSFDYIERGHQQKLRLCEQLEIIADGLPDRASRTTCRVVACELLAVLRDCHRVEENDLYPIFSAQGGDLAVIARLKTEHIQDECAAQDLMESLLSYSQDGPLTNPEALGYMLRAFFDAVRRHVAFEQDHVLPIVARNKKDGFCASIETK